MNYFKFLMFAGLIAVMAYKALPENAWPKSAWTKTTQQTIEVGPTWQATVKYAEEHLPLEGKLVVKRDGFAYLKVDDAYIHTLLPMLELKDKGFREPPYFRYKSSPGAHISVFYENERIKPAEIGQTFHFKPTRIAIVKTSKDDSYAILEIESPELEKLREKYGLSPKLNGNPFHISIGKKTFHH